MRWRQELELAQHTPTRVAQRRADLVRLRTVHRLACTAVLVLASPPHIGQLDLSLLLFGKQNSLRFQVKEQLRSNMAQLRSAHSTSPSSFTLASAGARRPASCRVKRRPDMPFVKSAS